MEKKYKVVATDNEIDLVRPDGFENDDDFWFYVALHGTDQIIGEIIYDNVYRNVEYYGNVGYSIDNGYQGHGYARKALALLVKILNATNQKHKLIINVYVDNMPSIKTAMNFGAKLVCYKAMNEKYIIEKNSGYSNVYAVFEYDVKSK